MIDNRLVEPLSVLLDRAPPSWRGVVQAWRRSAAGQALVAFVEARQAAGGTVYPNDPLRALHLCPLNRVRVVILGQDPYHGAGQAEGLAFSVPSGMRVPPSLRNIFSEIERDLGVPPARQGSLSAWAAQGVLLLNRVLTVEASAPASHAQQGWEALTDMLIDEVARQPRATAFLLWGAQAQSCARRLNPKAHLVLQSNHPSPLSAGRPPVPFIGNGHFSAVNKWLAEAGAAPLNWAAAQRAGAAPQP